MKRNNHKRLLNIEETAELLSISTRTIYNGVARKTKKPFPVKPIRIGRAVRFDIDDLMTFIDSLKNN